MARIYVGCKVIEYGLVHHLNVVCSLGLARYNFLCHTLMPWFLLVSKSTWVKMGMGWMVSVFDDCV